MSAKQKTLVMRGVRGVAAAGIAALVAWLGSSDVAGLLNGTEVALVQSLGIPALLVLEKSMRYGSEPGEVK